MARIKPVNKFTQAYNDFAMKPGVGRMVEWSLNARRFIILGKRAAGGAFPWNNAPNTSEHSVMDPYREELETRRKNKKETSPNTSEHQNFISNSDNKSLSDKVSIIDIDAKGYDDGYDHIDLPFIPKELNYDSQSSFVAIKGIGRNNPKYQYTGSEDILEFEIDWYAHDYARREVIEKCRKLEALSKADGYHRDPHRVMLSWGTDNVLFKDHIFLIISAKYRLVQFNKGFLGKDNQIVDTYMLPVQAYQTVRLARISSANMTKHQIEYVAYKQLTRKGSGEITGTEVSKELRGI